jgi:hypothetical protein
MIFFDMVTSLMLQHSLRAEFQPFRVVLLPMYLAVINLCMETPILKIGEAEYLYGYTFLVFFKISHFIIFAAKEICKVLGIRYVISPPYQSAH